MENKKNIEEAVIAGLFAEISLRRRLRRLKRNYKRRKQKRNMMRNLRRKRRLHRLPSGWRNIAVDGWDGMTM